MALPPDYAGQQAGLITDYVDPGGSSVTASGVVGPDGRLFLEVPVFLSGPMEILLLAIFDEGTGVETEVDPGLFGPIVIEDSEFSCDLTAVPAVVPPTTLTPTTTTTVAPTAVAPTTVVATTVVAPPTNGGGSPLGIIVLIGALVIIGGGAWYGFSGIGKRVTKARGKGDGGKTKEKDDQGLGAAPEPNDDVTTGDTDLTETRVGDDSGGDDQTEIAGRDDSGGGVDLSSTASPRVAFDAPIEGLNIGQDPAIDALDPGPAEGNDLTIVPRPPEEFEDEDVEGDEFEDDGFEDDEFEDEEFEGDEFEDEDFEGE